MLRDVTKDKLDALSLKWETAGHVLSEIEARIHLFYAQRDGSVCVPSTAEGDIIVMLSVYFNLKAKE